DRGCDRVLLRLRRTGDTGNPGMQHVGALRIDPGERSFVRQVDPAATDRVGDHGGVGGRRLHYCGPLDVAFHLWRSPRPTRYPVVAALDALPVHALRLV